VLGVAVFHNPQPELLARTESEVAPDLFQAETESLAGLPADRILPVVVDGVGLEDSVNRALGSTEIGMVLIDSAAKGGTGRAPDWARLATLRTSSRVILAGGLDPKNVGVAVSTVNPFGVDVSSGIERAPGEKDPDLMRAFVTAARREAR
jgi:phosphoribosylanthranilate isomerase